MVIVLLRIKKSIVSILAMIMCSILLLGISIPMVLAAESITAETVSLSDNSITIGEGETYCLDAQISPTDATTGKGLKWSSYNTTVAKVDNYGNITAVNEGRTTIKCELIESGSSDTCIVEVVPSLKSVSIETKEITLVAGKTRQLSFSYKPSNIHYSHVQEWTSENPHIATVTRDGLVTARSEGETVVMVKYGDLSDTCRVRVLPQSQEISISPSLVTMTKGENYTLTAKALPGEQIITDETTWTSSDPTIVRVSSSGKLTAISNGKATIRAELNGMIATCDVVVSNSIKEIILSDETVDMRVGETRQISATTEPEYLASDISFQWGSEDPTIATVSNKGMITARSKGTTTIRCSVSTPTGSMSQGCIVNVTESDNDSTLPNDIENDDQKPNDSESNDESSPEPTEQDANKTQLYIDVPKSIWYTAAVYYVSDMGYMTGVAEGYFDPKGTVTRGTIAQILYAAEGKPIVYENSEFSDVEKGRWYANAITWAENNKIVSGYEDGKFGPNDPVTRQQLVAIMYQYAKLKKFDTKANALLDNYNDSNQISGYAFIPMKWAVLHKVISGTNIGIEPKGTATRAQIAVMLKAFDENVRVTGY